MLKICFIVMAISTFFLLGCNSEEEETVDSVETEEVDTAEVEE